MIESNLKAMLSNFVKDVIVSYAPKLESEYEALGITPSEWMNKETAKKLWVVREYSEKILALTKG